MSLHDLTIRKALALNKSLGLEGVLIVGLSGGTIKGVSYGSTIAQCRQLGKALDFAVDAFERGEVNLSSFEDGDCPWPTLRQGEGSS